MTSILDVAKFIMQTHETMSEWKLQKLCYYAQAWSIAWTESPLFNEDFEAWSNGPVCRKLFCVPHEKFYISEKDLSQGNCDNLNDEQKETINIVLRDYGTMMAYELEDLVCSEKPWLEVHSQNSRKDYKPIISKEAMGEFYGSL